MPFCRKINGEWVPQTVARRINGDWTEQTKALREGGSWADLDPSPTVYTWKKYELIADMVIDSYAQTSSSGGTEKYGIGGTVYTSYSFDASSGTYSSAGSTTGIVSGGYDGFGASMAQYSFLYYDTDSNYAWFSVTNYGVEIDTSHYEYSRGSYIEDVTSDNASAFPTDGYINGYWYVAVL